MTVYAAHPAQGKLRSRLRGETSRRVIASLISTALVLQPIAAQAGPSGGVVKAGNASISTSGLNTTVEQIDGRVVIDWSSFDIDVNESVTFRQPTNKAIALNRVLDTLPTNIRGKLEANGHVWIVNQNGVTFHAGSIVDVGGLLATTADITNADFMAGRNNFTIPGKPGAQIINHGSITFGEAGLAGLVAPGAQNHGRIAGKLGSVIVAGERTFAIDLAGDGMFAFEPAGASDFAGQAINTGTISNHGGYILIAARTANKLVDNSISLGGVVEATTAEMRNGKIVLSGGDGLVNVAGRIDASGGAGQTGGSVKVSGGRIDVQQTAAIDVSGGTGGGTVEVGGGWQGASMGTGLRNADATVVRSGAAISADAGQTGDGGTVVVWADGRTGYGGTISATGGVQSGNGGSVEVSGKQGLAFAGFVDTTAQNGSTGSLLLDPDRIAVDDVLPTLEDAFLADGIVDFAEGAGNDIVISRTALEAASVLNDVELRAEIGVRIEDLEAGDLGTPDLLNLSNNFTVETGSEGFVVAGADDTINFNGNDFTVTTGGAGTDGNTGPITLSGVDNAGQVSLTGESITFNGAFNAASLNASADGGSISDGATGALTITGTTTLTATDGADFFDIALDNAGAHDFAQSQAFAATGGDITLHETSGITLDALNTNVNADPTIASNGGDLVLDVGGAVVQSAAATIPGTTTISGGASGIRLTDTGNDFTGAVSSTSTGTLELTDTNEITLDTVSAGTLTVVAGGDITDTANAITVTGTAEFDATGFAVELDNGPHNFNNFLASGAAITLNETDAVKFGTVTATDTLTVTAGGDITDFATTPGAPITVANATTLNAGANDIVLDRAGVHDFSQGQSFTATAGNLTVADISGIKLGALTLTGDLDLTVGGVVVQTAAAIVPGTTTISSGLANGIFLTDLGNDFGGAVSSDSTGSLELTDIDDIVLGTISAGFLTVNAGGAITDVPGTITVTNTTAMNAPGFAITLDDGPHDFNIFAATGDTVEVNEANAIRLGNVNSTNNLTLDAGGDITQVGGTTVVTGGTLTTLNSGGDVTLTETGNQFATVTGTATGFDLAELDGLNIAGMTATAGDINIESPGNVLVNDATIAQATGDIALTATGIGGAGAVMTAQIIADSDSSGAGSLSISSVNSVVGGADASTLQGADVTLTGNSVTTGTVTATTGGIDIDATGAGVALNGPVTAPTSVEVDAATNVAILAGGTSDTLSVTAQDVDISGATFTATNGATFTNSAGDATALGAAEDADATTFEITEAGLNLIAGSGITVSSGVGPITVADTSDNAVDLTSAGTPNLTLNAPGAGGVSVQGLTAGALVVDAGTGALDFGVAPSSLTSLIVSQSDTISQTVALAVTGETDLTSANPISLLDPANDFGGAVSAGGAGAGSIAAALNDANDIVLGDIDATTLTVTAGGGITQTPAAAAGDAVDVSGDTALTAIGAITLDSTLNDFADNAGAGETDLSGTAITLADADAVNLGTVTGTSLTLTTGGDVTQTGAGQAIAITGLTTINATGGAVTLTETTNDLTQVSGSSNSFDIVETGGVDLRGIDAVAGDVDVSSDGNVFASSVPGVQATGDISLSSTGAGQVGALAASRIVADSDSSGTGDVTLTSAAGTVGGATNTVLQGNTVTLTGPSVTAGTVTATSANIDIDATTGLVQLQNTATAATDIDINAATDITLSDTNAASLVAMTTNGDITQLAGTTVAVTGTSDLTANGAGQNIALAEATNDFGGTVTASAADGSVTLNDANDLTLGPVVAGNGLDVDAGNDLAVDGAVSNGGAPATLDAGNDITVNAAIDGGNTDLTLTAGGGIVTGGAGTLDTDGGSIALSANEEITLGASVTALNGGLDISADANADGADNLTLTGGTALTGDDALTVAIGGTGAIVDTGAGGVTLTGGGAGGIVGLPEITFTGNTLTVSTVAPNSPVSGPITLGNPITIANAFTAQTAGVAVSLTNAANDFNGAVNVDTTLGIAAPAAVEIVNSGGVALGTIHASDLTVTAGTINNSGAGIINATGLTTLSAGAGAANVNLTNDHDFETVAATGLGITLNDVDNISLSTVTANSLTVTAGGTIADSGADPITVTGATTLTAQNGADFFDILLDNAGVHAIGDFTATGEDITLNTTTAVVLGAVTTNDDSAAVVDPTINNGNDGDLTITSGGSVTQAATVTAPGLTTIDATGAVALTDAANDLTALSGTATAFDIDETGGVALSGLTATAGDIELDSTGDVLVADATTTQATGNIRLESSTASTVSAVNTGQVIADSDSDLAGTLAMTSAGGQVGGDAGSLLQGSTVTLSGGTVATGTVTATNGAVDVDAATGAATLGGPTTATTALDINAATEATVSGGSAQTLTITAADVAFQTAAFTVDGGTGDASLTNSQGDDTNLGTAEDGDPTTFEIADAGLDLIDAGTILLFSGGGVTILEGASPASTANLTIDGGGNDVNVTGAASTITGDLIVTNAAAVDGGALSVGGTTDITSTTVTLDDPANDFGGAVSAAADLVLLADANAIQLGTITTSDLSVMAAGSITDTAGQAIAVAGSTVLDAGTFDILLANGLHDFDALGASGGDITLVDTDDIQLDFVTTAANADPTIGTNGGDLNLTAGGDVTQSPLSVPRVFPDVLQIAGTTTVVAIGSDVILDHPDNDLAGTINIAGNNINIRNDALTSSSTRLGDIDAAGDLIVGGRAISIVGNGDGAAGEDINVAGTTSLSAGSLIAGTGLVSLNDASNDFVGDVSVLSWGSISLVDVNDIALGDVQSINMGSLTVRAGGTITDTPGKTIAIPRATTLIATDGTDFFDIKLDNGPHAFSTSFDFTATGGDIAVNASTGMRLGALTLNANADPTIMTDNAGNLELTTAGAITQSGVATVPGTTEIDAAGFDVTLGQANRLAGRIDVEGANVTLANDLRTILGDVDASGDLTVTSLDEITGDGDGAAGEDVNVAGEATLDGTLVTLTDASNDFEGAVSATADTVVLNDLDDITLGTITASSGLTATAGGAIRDTATSTVTVTGATTLDAGGFDISLADGTHDFDEANDFTAMGGDISLSDVDGIQLGALTLAANADPTIGSNGGDLRITTGGDITQTAAATVPGTSTIDASGSNITLTQSNLFGGVVSAVDGGDIALTDADGIILGDTAAAGSLTVVAQGGAVTNDAGGTIIVVGETSVDAGTFDILLDNAGHDFGSFTADAGDITLTDTNAIEFGALTLNANTDPTIGTNGGDLVVTAGGEVTQTAVADVPGTTTIDAAGSDITLTQDNLFGDTVNAAGADIRLVDADGIVLGDVDATGLFDVTARAGSITDDGAGNAPGADVDVDGSTTLIAMGGSIALDDSANNFDADAGAGNDAADTVTATADAVTLADEDAIALGSVTASNGLAVTAGGSVTDSAGTITVTGTTDIEAGTFDIALDNGSHDFDTLSATGGDITVVDINDIDFGALTLNANADPTIPTNGGDLIVVAGGNVSQSGGAISVPGDTMVSAPGFVALPFGANTFGGPVDIDGSDISLTGQGDVQLGTINASGDLRVVSETGSITDTAGRKIDAQNLDTLVAQFGDIVLDNASLHDFGSVSASAVNLVLDDVDDIDLADISRPASSVRLDITAGGAITDSGTINASAGSVLQTESAGTATIVIDGADNRFAGTVTLDTDINDDGGEADITFIDNDLQLLLGNVDGQNVTLTSTGDAVAGDTLGIFGAAGVQDIEGTATYLTSNGRIDISNAANDFSGVVKADADLDMSGNPGRVAITDANSVLLGDVDAGDLVVTALAGSITDDGAGNATGMDVNADGRTTLSATAEITLDDAGTNFDADAGAMADASDRVDALAPGMAVTLVDEDAIAFGAVTVGSLDVTAGGSITDDTAAIAIAGLADFKAGSFDIRLDNGLHDFDTVRAVGGDMSFSDISGIRFDTLALTANTDPTIGSNGGDLTVVAAGTVTDTAGQAITAPGITDINAGLFDIRLDNGLNDFGTLAATGGDITVVDINAINLGRVTANVNTDPTIPTNGGDLIVRAGGNITQSAPIMIPGESGFGTPGDITLPGPGNSFGGPVDLGGNDLTLAANGTIQLGTVTAGGFLDVRSFGGSIIDTPTRKIDAPNMDTFVAESGNVTLDNTRLHDFGVVDASTIALEIEDVDDIDLGNISRPADTTSLRVTAGGAITDSGTIKTSEDPVFLTESADGSALITIDGPDNTFAGTVTLDTDFNADGGEADITFIDNDTRLELGTVRGKDVAIRSTGDADAADTLGIFAANGVQTVTGTATYETNDGLIDLSNPANDFSMVVKADADLNMSGDPGQVTITDVNSVLLGDVDAGDLTVTALDGSITDDSAGNASGMDVNADGQTVLTATTEITLDDDGTNFDANAGATADAIDRVDASGTVITLIDEDAIALGSVVATAAGVTALDVTAGGSITDDAQAIMVTSGLTDLKAGTFDIALDNGMHDFMTLTAVGGDMTFTDINAIEFGALTLNPNTDTTIGSNLGDLSVTADGDITQTAGTILTVPGTSDFDNAGFDIVLPEDNLFGMTVDAEGVDIALVDADNIILGDVDAKRVVTDPASRGDLDVWAKAGSITDDGDGNATGADVNVDGETTLRATAEIALDDAGTNFDEDAGASADPTIDAADKVNADGTLITLVDEDAIALGVVDGDTLTLTAGGSVTDTAGDMITIGGLTNIDTGGDFDIALDNTNAAGGPLHNFGPITANAGDIEIRNAGATVLAGLTTNAANTDPTIGGSGAGSDSGSGGFPGAAENLVIISGGDVTQTAPIFVSGTTFIDAEGSDITLLDDNDFSRSVTVRGKAVRLNDINDLFLDDSVVTELLEAFARDNIEVLRVTVNPVLNGDGEIETGGRTLLVATDETATIDDLIAGDLTVTAGTGATMTDFSLASLDLTAGGGISLDNGSVTGPTSLKRPAASVALNDVTIKRLSTRSLTAVDFGTVTMDRVGFLDGNDPNVLAELTVKGTEIVLGFIRAAVADLEATTGNISQLAEADIDYAGSNAGTGFTITNPLGTAPASTNVTPSGLRKFDPDLNDPLINVATELRVAAAGNVLVENGVIADRTIDRGNLIERIVVDSDIGDLTVDTANELVVSRINDAKVGEVDIESERGITLDLEVDGDLDIFGGFAPDRTTVLNSANVTINGTVSGNATATATNNATIDGIVGGNATAKAIGGAASIGGTVGGNASADAAGVGTIDAGVGGNATILAGTVGNLSGTVGGDADVKAGSGVVLAGPRTLDIAGSLAVDSDNSGPATAASSITQTEAVTVTGKTELTANGASEIVLNVTDNDFGEGEGDTGGVLVSNARRVELSDTDALAIRSLDNIGEDVVLIAGETLTLRDEDGSVRNGDGVDDYIIGAGQTWSLTSRNGDIDLVGSIATEAGPTGGSMVLEAGNGTIRFQDFVGLGTVRDNPIVSDRPLNSVTVTDAVDVIFGLNKAIADPDDPATIIGNDDFVGEPGRNQDIFFARDLVVESASGDLLLVLAESDENTADFVNQYFGLNLTDGLRYPVDGSPTKIDLFGKIGNTRTKAAGLSPIGPRDGNFEFNNCIIGDPNNCSAITQAGVLQLIDPRPAEVFRLDTDQVEQLFLSFGNEELWGLPSVFTTDLEDPGDNDDEEEEEQ